MALFTKIPVNHSFNGPDSQTQITCDVGASSVHILIKRNSIVVHDADYSGEIQGASSHYSTLVDVANWEVNVTGSPLTVFTLTAPG